MTDFTNTQPIRLTNDQWLEIQALGKKALAAITAAQAQGLSAPVGIWQSMYSSIFGLIHNNQVSGAPPQQGYWFEQAPFINGANNNVPSGYFVRDVTAVGMRISGGPNDPQIQAVSDAIGEQIFNNIAASAAKGTPQLPAFWQQLNMDIYGALNGPPTGFPWTYKTLRIQSWGGTF